jgi:hypothetical protein
MQICLQKFDINNLSFTKMVVHLGINTDYECAVEEHRPHLDL